MTSALPANPDIAQLRRRAKELLRDAKAGDLPALQRLAHVAADATIATLSDAHTVLAREHGFASWPKLRSAVAELSQAHTGFGAAQPVFRNKTVGQALFTANVFIEGAMNAVLVKGDAVGATLYYGAGAGAEPTASAVIADLVDVTRMHTADPEHRVPHLAFQPDQISDLPVLPIGEVETSYYLRMRVDDRPGVLADITRILADREISIDAMIQKEPSEGEDQTDIILLTHITREKNVNVAISRIEALSTVTGKIVRLRLEALS